MPTVNRSSFRDLRVWQSALELAETVYRETAVFPAAERYGLTSQMRRCAVSAVANIAEGKGRYGSRQFAAFLDIAHGSLRELEALALLAARLKLLQPEAYSRVERLTNVTISQLLRLLQHLRNRAPKAHGDDNGH